eukprot:gene8037-12503_t
MGTSTSRLYGLGHSLRDIVEKYHEIHQVPKETRDKHLKVFDDEAMFTLKHWTQLSATRKLKYPDGIFGETHCGFDDLANKLVVMINLAFGNCEICVLNIQFSSSEDYLFLFLNLAIFFEQTMERNDEFYEYASNSWNQEVPSFQNQQTTEVFNNQQNNFIDEQGRTFTFGLNGEKFYYRPVNTNYPPNSTELQSQQQKYVPPNSPQNQPLDLEYNRNTTFKSPENSSTKPINDKWSVYFDPKSNRNYYYNSETKQTVWEKPQEKKKTIPVSIFIYFPEKNVKFQIQIGIHDSILEMKSKILDQTGIEPEFQTLTFGQIKLENDKATLLGSGIYGGNTIILVDSTLKKGELILDVRTLDGSITKLRVNRSTKILEIKEMIKEELGVVLKKQKLFAAEGRKELHNQLKLSDCGIFNSTTIHLVVGKVKPHSFDIFEIASDAVSSDLEKIDFSDEYLIPKSYKTSTVDSFHDESEPTSYHNESSNLRNIPTQSNNNTNHRNEGDVGDKIIEKVGGTIIEKGIETGIDAVLNSLF